MKRERGVPYGVELPEVQCMDLFDPEEGANGCAIYFVHGGGWSGGGRKSWSAVAEHFCRRGFFCASADYRLVPGAIFPAQIEDVRLGMSVFRSMADCRGFSASRIAAVGSSAGGHLVGLLATIAPGDELGTAPAMRAGDTRPDAAVCYCPVATLHEADQQWEGLKEAIRSFLGKSEADDPDVYRAASPADRIRGGEPPFLFLHGRDDDTVPLSQSTEMADALRRAGGTAEVVEFPGVGHGFGYGVTSAAQKTAVAHVERFLARCFQLGGQDGTSQPRPRSV